MLPQTNFPSYHEEAPPPPQAIPDQFVESIMKFYQKLLRERNHRIFQLKYISNIDETPLPFVLDAHTTSNDNVSAEETWVPDA